MPHHKHAFHHIFDRVCDGHNIEYRLTMIKHSWTNGQVERMNRSIKEATVKRCHYDNHGQLTAHLHDFINAYLRWPLGSVSRKVRRKLPFYCSSGDHHCTPLRLCAQGKQDRPHQGRERQKRQNQDQHFRRELWARRERRFRLVRRVRRGNSRLVWVAPVMGER